MSRTGGSAGAPLVMAGVLGALNPVGYLERWLQVKLTEMTPLKAQL
jgi:hypothetical protein